jgi:hypothetical protein
MKTLLILLVLTPLCAAAPLTCGNNGSPRLTGDLFAPVECAASTAVVAAAPLSVPPAVPAAKGDLKDLLGRWEGTAFQGFGRYDVAVELVPGRRGKARATMKLLEMQFHRVSAHTLQLVPGKGRGRYEIELATDALADRTLKGTVSLGDVDVSSAAAGAPRPLAGARQMDFAFVNGAQYRVRFAPADASTMRVQVWWTVPGAPERSFEALMARKAPAKP